MHALSEKKVQKLFHFTQRWDGKCYLCGTPFENMACVTRDHITPISLGGPKGRKKSYNELVAPTHSSCNNFRGNASLIQTAKKLEEKRRVMGHKAFAKWANMTYPGYKKIHWTAFISSFDLAWFC